MVVLENGGAEAKHADLGESSERKLDFGDENMRGIPDRTPILVCPGLALE